MLRKFTCKVSDFNLLIPKQQHRKPRIITINGISVLVIASFRPFAHSWRTKTATCTSKSYNANSLHSVLAPNNKPSCSFIFIAAEVLMHTYYLAVQLQKDLRCQYLHTDMRDEVKITDRVGRIPGEDKRMQKKFWWEENQVDKAAFAKIRQIQIFSGILRTCIIVLGNLTCFGSDKMYR